MRMHVTSTVLAAMSIIDGRWEGPLMLIPCHLDTQSMGYPHDGNDGLVFAMKQGWNADPCCDTGML